MAHLLNRYSQILAGLGTCGLFTVSFLPQTLRIGTYKEVLANYQDGQIQPITDEIKTIIERVLFRMKVGVEEEAHLDFFTCFGNDPVHKGSVYVRSGAIVGIPPTFYYKTPADIDQSLRAGGRIINWETDAGKRLSDSIMLSEKAKAFGIAREINYASSYHIYIDGFMRAVFFSMAYSSGYMLNRGVNLRERLKMWARGGIYGMLAGTAYFLYTLTSDAYFCQRDNKVDKKTAKLGWAYAEGGVEFYNKAVERNVALRELMGPEGAKSYTVYGNEVTSVRRSQVQLTERRNKLLKYFGEYQEREKASEGEVQAAS